MKRLLPPLLAAACCLAHPALGHGVRTTVARDPAVAVAFTYEDGSPLSFEEYEVLPPGDTTAFQVGSTDRAGRAVFRPDRAGTWRVRLWTEDGHGATLDVDVDEALLAVAETGKGPGRLGKLITGVSVVFGVFGIVALVGGRRTA